MDCLFFSYFLMNRSFKFWSNLIHHLFHLWLLLSVLCLRKSAYSHVSYFLSKSFIGFYIYGCHELIFVCGVRWRLRFIFFVWIFVCSSTILLKGFPFPDELLWCLDSPYTDESTYGFSVHWSICPSTHIHICLYTSTMLS